MNPWQIELYGLNREDFRDPCEARNAHKLSFPVTFVVKCSLSSLHAYTYAFPIRWNCWSSSTEHHSSPSRLGFVQVYINPLITPFLSAILIYLCPMILLSPSILELYILYIQHICAQAVQLQLKSAELSLLNVSYQTFCRASCTILPARAYGPYLLFIWAQSTVYLDSIATDIASVTHLHSQLIHKLSPNIENPPWQQIELRSSTTWSFPSEVRSDLANILSTFRKPLMTITLFESDRDINVKEAECRRLDPWGGIFGDFTYWDYRACSPSSHSSFDRE